MPLPKMISALVLALRQLADPAILRILAKCVTITLLLFIVLGALGWWGIDALLALGGLDDATFSGADGIRGLAALVAVIIGGWLLWRILAVAVLQFYANEVVEAVEARHYPAALAGAKELPWRRELVIGLRGASRSLVYNLLALPFAALGWVTPGLAALGMAASSLVVTGNALRLGADKALRA